MDPGRHHDRAQLVDHPEPDYFVCGPDPMVDLVTTILTERWEVPPNRVHTELFGVV